VVRAVTVLLSVLALVVGSAAKDSAIVEAGSRTTVNEVAVVDSLSVFDGQSVANDGVNFASLRQAGTAVRLLGATTLIYHPTNSEFTSGIAAVTTSTGYALTSKCFTVKPVNEATSRYTVAYQEGKIFVWAEVNDVTIKGRREVRVQQSKIYTITGCGTPGEVIENTQASSAKWKYLFAGAAAAAAPLLRAGAGSKEPEKMSADHP
jgi:hypothetical protein